MAETLSSGDLTDNFDIDTLDLDIEDLDDVEYDLPPVDEAPTLESILNDLNERTSLSEDELSNVLMPSGEAGFDGSETQSMCSVDARSRTSSEHRHGNRRRMAPSSGSILRHVILKGISSQLNSACDRVDAGSPTAMAVTTMIAVGTSHGLVLVFDSSQTLRWCLGATERDQGAVSSLGFNHDCTRLLAGYARGHILMFDVAAGKLLRTMADVHQPGTAVLHVKFTDSPTLALCSDSGGSVFELNFRRTMGVRGCDSKCLFSGSRGEVVALEPLLLEQFVSHPLRGAVLVAMATLSKVLVVSIRPRTRVVFTHPLVGRPTSLPLLAWQFVVIQMSDGSRVVDPVLAFARDQTLHFYQVCVDSNGRPRLSSLQLLAVTYSLLSLRWLNSRTMAALDSMEQLHLVDVRTREELDCVDLSPVGLVYATSHFKGLANGGNVSKALALAGERACYNSVLSFGNQLLLVGIKSFHVLTIRSWVERLDLLTRAERYLEALALAMSFYTDQGKAVVGLKGPKQLRKEIAREKVLEILHQYMEVSVQPDSSPAALHEAVPALMEHCIELDVLDVLYDKLWDACCDLPSARAVYLESLEPWILSRRIASLPPAISQQLVAHYEQCGMLVALEAMITRLDVCSLDVDQVMRLSETHGLLDAKIHVYNQGLADYITPLLDLLSRLQAALATGKQLSDLNIAHGNKLLVYVSCCLAGRAYPSGEIPAARVRNVKHEVFTCLTCLHARDASDSEPAYPYLRALLSFDSAEFINVVALALQEPEFDSEMGQRQIQRLIDILVQIMIQGQGFSGGQVACLVGLITRQLAQGLQLERGVIEKAAQLVAQSGPAQHELRQTALLELMRAEALQHCDRDWLLDLATQASFYRVCEVLYTERGETDKVLLCYLRDPARKSQVFGHLRALLAASRGAALAGIEAQVRENISELIAIDWSQTGQLVRINMPHLIGNLVDKLEEKELFRLLQGLMECKDEPPLEAALVEKYIDLMCQFEPSSVLAFVSSTDTYRLEQALQTVQQWKLLDATVHLLERTGSHAGALDLLLSHLHSAPPAATVAAACDVCRHASPAEASAMWLTLLDAVLRHSEARAMAPQLLAAMSGHVALPKVVEAVLRHPACAGGTFGDIRDLVMGMLSHSSYERRLLESTSRLHGTDLHRQLAVVLSHANRGISPRSVDCCVCRRPLKAVAEEDRLVLFRCGHGFHASCLGPSAQCCLCSDSVASASWPTPPPPAPPVHVEHTPANLPTGLLQSREFQLKLAAPPMPPDLEGIF